MVMNALVTKCVGDNIRQLMEWDGPLLLVRNIETENDGVKQNVLGALRLLLEKQFGE